MRACGYGWSAAYNHPPLLASCIHPKCFRIGLTQYCALGWRTYCWTRVACPTNDMFSPYKETTFKGSSCSWGSRGYQALPSHPISNPHPWPRSPVYPPVSVSPAPSHPSWLIQNIDLTLTNSSMQIRQVTADHVEHSFSITMPPSPIPISYSYHTALN